MTLTIDTQKTVRDLALEIPSATRIFEKLGIDYCCGGSRTLSDACANVGIPLEQVVTSLEAAQQPPQDAVDWKEKSLFELISHIVAKHHAFTRQEIERLDSLTDKVCSVHGKNHPELEQIRALFRGLGQELFVHMHKEEQVLFPYVVRMEEAISNGEPVPVPLFGTVQNPIRMMMFEHDAAGEVLRKIRQASSNFTVPPDGCISYQTLYQALEAFEQNLHQHIHLENNILFPRAIEMESAA